MRWPTRYAVAHTQCCCDPPGRVFPVLLWPPLGPTALLRCLRCAAQRNQIRSVHERAADSPSRASEGVQQRSRAGGTADSSNPALPGIPYHARLRRHATSVARTSPHPRLDGSPPWQLTDSNDIFVEHSERVDSPVFQAQWPATLLFEASDVMTAFIALTTTARARSEILISSPPPCRRPRQHSNLKLEVERLSVRTPPATGGLGLARCNPNLERNPNPNPNPNPLATVRHRQRRQPSLRSAGGAALLRQSLRPVRRPLWIPGRKHPQPGGAPGAAARQLGLPPHARPLRPPR